MAFSQTEALNILKAESIEGIEDSYEQLIFDFKQKYLQKIPPIPLMNSQIKIINRVEKAYSVFVNYSSDYKLKRQDLNSDLNILLFLNEYQIKLSVVRLRISQADNGKILMYLIEELINLEKCLIDYFTRYSSQLDFEFMDKIKISEDIDIFKVQVELKEIELKESKILDYLRKNIVSSNEKVDSILLKLVLKVKKMNQLYGD